jgi:hypothetical protein
VPNPCLGRASRLRSQGLGGRSQKRPSGLCWERPGRGPRAKAQRRKGPGRRWCFPTETSRSRLIRVSARAYFHTVALSCPAARHSACCIPHSQCSIPPPGCPAFCIPHSQFSITGPGPAPSLCASAPPRLCVKMPGCPAARLPGCPAFCIPHSQFSIPPPPPFASLRLCARSCPAFRGFIHRQASVHHAPAHRR